MQQYLYELEEFISLEVVSQVTVLLGEAKNWKLLDNDLSKSKLTEQVGQAQELLSEFIDANSFHKQ